MNTSMLVLASTLTLTAPDNGATYDTHTPWVNEFLSHPAERSVKPEEPPLSPIEIKRRDEQTKKYEEWVAGGKQGPEVKPWCRYYDFYLRNEWTEALFKRSEEGMKTYRPFKWNSDFKLKDGRIEFSETKDFAKPIHEPLPDGAVDKFPWFLKLGTKYWWRVVGKDESGAEVVSDVREFTTLDNPPRMIGTPGMNCRDMGGGTNMEGRKVRQGLVYRGQKAHSNSLVRRGKTQPEELKWMFVDTLGVRTQLDLRSQGEHEAHQAKWNCLGFDKVGCQHTFHPIFPYLLRHGDVAKEMRKIFHEFSIKENYPIYFNCSVGSDRTGTVAVIFDGVIGRSDEQIYNNYELPCFNWNLARLRYSRKPSGMFGMLDPKLDPTTGGANIAENCVKYLKSIGVTDEEIQSIRDIMLEK